MRTGLRSGCAMRWFGNSRGGLFEPCALSLKCRLEWLLGRYRPAAPGRKPPLDNLTRRAPRFMLTARFFSRRHG